MHYPVCSRRDCRESRVERLRDDRRDIWAEYLRVLKINLICADELEKCRLYRLTTCIIYLAFFSLENMITCCCCWLLWSSICRWLSVGLLNVTKSVWCMSLRRWWFDDFFIWKMWNLIIQHSNLSYFFRLNVKCLHKSSHLSKALNGKRF